MLVCFESYFRDGFFKRGYVIDVDKGDLIKKRLGIR